MRSNQPTAFYETQSATPDGDVPLNSHSEPHFAEAFVPFQPRGSADEPVDSPTAPEAAGAHLRIESFPIDRVIRKQRRFRETDNWEGSVTDVADAGIGATLNRRYEDFPAEEAFIPWDEIALADRPLAKPGAIFQWKVGYLQVEGQTFSVSHIEFRRVPNFSAREVSKAAAKAASYASLFDHGEGV